MKNEKREKRDRQKIHPSLATSYHNLSMIYQQKGDRKRALRFSQDAVDILQRAFPNGHPNLDITKRNLESIKSQIHRKS